MRLSSRRSDASERLRALLELPDGPGFRESLLRALDDRSLEIVRVALGRLARVGGELERRELERRMLDSDVALVKDYARAILALGGGAAAELAVRELAAAGNSRRLAAALALEVLATDGDAPALRGALHDRTAGVRAAALRTLSGLTRSQTNLAACAQLLRDADPSVRAEAVEAVARSGRSARALLEPVAFDQDAGVRRAVARHTSRLAPLDAAALLRDPDPHVRELAAETAGAGAIGLLGELLRSEPLPRVRLAAVKHLGDLGRPAVITMLIGALADSDSTVRAAAFQSLGRRLSRTDLLGRLRDVLASPKPALRKQAVYCLAELGSRLAEPALADELARDTDLDVRIAAAHSAAALMRDPQRLLGLLECDPHPAVRSAAAKARRSAA